MRQYDIICAKFDLKKKVFKVVVDNAANNKKAFSGVEPALTPPEAASKKMVDNTERLLANQRIADAEAERQAKLKVLYFIIYSNKNQT